MIFNLMILNKYNIFSNIRNDQFLPNIVEGDNDSSFNSDENAIINNQILIPLEPNDFFRSDDNIFDFIIHFHSIIFLI